jgi:hypothetical protein
MKPYCDIFLSHWHRWALISHTARKRSVSLLRFPLGPIGGKRETRAIPIHSLPTFSTRHVPIVAHRNLSSLGGRCPPNPLGFFAFGCTRRDGSEFHDQIAFPAAARRGNATHELSGHSDGAKLFPSFMVERKSAFSLTKPAAAHICAPWIWLKAGLFSKSPGEVPVGPATPTAPHRPVPSQWLRPAPLEW